MDRPLVCVADKLCLVGLPKRFRLLLQKSIAPMAHLGDEQCMEVLANLQESFQVADLSSWELFTYFTCLISGLVKN